MHTPSFVFANGEQALFELLKGMGYQFYW